jgi:hypothetical protein
MSQHSFSIPDESGAAFRADVNNALQALASQSSGASEPATRYSYQMWPDTTASVLKRRNAANSAWIIVGSLSETFVVSRASNTILGVSDYGKTFVATASFTQTLDAVATLKDGWWCDYRIESGVTIVFDPNAAENIDGVATKSVTGPAGGTIRCDGSGFKTIGMEGFVTGKHGADIASAGTLNLDAATGDVVDVTGTTTVTAITLADGVFKVVRFTGALTLTHGASLVLPGAANIVTAAGDFAVFRGYAAGVVRCTQYIKASGAPILMSPITNSLGADVLLNNTASYFDGPSVAQGTSGTWFVSGTIMCLDTAGAANFFAKLWDGTTLIASGIVASSGANQTVTFSLSGFINSPAGNIRISVRDATATTGKIVYNSSALSKDCTITAIRIG